MNPDRKNIKDEEHRLLQVAALTEPELFALRTFVEDARFLKRFGISIPGKTAFPEGYLKFRPEDFIVEEIATDDTVFTIEKEDSPPITGEGSTTYATLVKCSLSTLEAVEDIARQLHCDPKAIGYAGIKDKDAITAQRLSFRKISPAALLAISSPYFFLKDITRGKGVVETGGLKGNRFTLLIRTAPEFLDQEAIDNFTQNVARIQNSGFSNFFYLQRFGTPRLTNYTWALLILRGEYLAAVFDILTYGAPRELPYFINIRKQCEEKFGDWEAIENLLAPYPIIFRHELQIVRFLKDHPEDPLGALTQISDQVVMWLYALSSKYFNEKISEYLETATPIPDKLPLFLSADPEDLALYESFLRRDGIFPPPWGNLRAFPKIQMRHREVPTSDQAKLLHIEVAEQGLVISFELGKGQYATTFLSHLFTLISGKIPDSLETSSLDIKATLGTGDLAETLDYFLPIITPKTDGQSLSLE